MEYMMSRASPSLPYTKRLHRLLTIVNEIKTVMWLYFTGHLGTRESSELVKAIQ